MSYIAQLNIFNDCDIVDAMNIQTHETTGASPYELAFGKKARTILFPGTTRTNVLLEEELENDGVCIEEQDCDVLAGIEKHMLSNQQVCS